jgi:tetratricopeptide (TPR) repeat protein
MLQVRAAALTHLGRFEEAWSQLRKAERAAEESRELEVMGWVKNYWVQLAYACGGGELLEHARLALEIAEKLDNDASRVVAHQNLGLAHLLDGQASAARDALRQSAAIARERRTLRSSLAWVLAELAEAHVALGERAEAVAAAREAIEIASAGGCRYYEADAQLALARALLAPEGALPRAEIEAALARAEQLVESVAARALSPRILELRGRLATAQRDAPVAGRLLRQALALYRQLGATGHAERLARELGA